MERAVGYARLGSQRIAYETFGSGSVDLVLTTGSFSAFDTDWEDPMAELFLRRLASFARVIRFDRRGAGASDALTLDALPPWEARWREVLDMHDDTARRLLETNGRRLIKTTGDGVLTTFDGPGRAIRFATEFREQLKPIGLSIRTGIHTGELETRGDDVGGMAVHLAARILALAGGGENLVSRTVKDLVVGSRLSFEDRGTHRLKSIKGEWQLLAVRPGS
jgi:hypothetical protein